LVIKKRFLSLFWCGELAPAVCPSILDTPCVCGTILAIYGNHVNTQHDLFDHSNTVNVPVCPILPEFWKITVFLDGSLTSPVCPYDSRCVWTIQTGHNRTCLSATNWPEIEPQAFEVTGRRLTA